jgi:hypothetical protein
MSRHVSWHVSVPSQVSSPPHVGKSVQVTSQVWTHVGPVHVKLHMVGQLSQVSQQVSVPLQVCVPSIVKSHPCPAAHVGVSPSHVIPGSVQVLFQHVISASQVGLPSHVDLSSQVYDPLQVQSELHVGDTASQVGSASCSV